MTFHIHKGDLEPGFDIPISGADGNLATRESLRIVAEQGGVPLFTDTNPTVVVDPANSASATVSHNWVAGQTDVAGDVWLRVEVGWPGGRVTTFPKRGRLKARIHP